ncbi:unnamed protein product [Schistosoma turkestanicum]|nr:unnamed protein product [Schistosoma turkestanicum]
MKHLFYDFNFQILVLYTSPDKCLRVQCKLLILDPNSIPPDVTRNISTVGRRPGPPPPAPERRDSVPQKPVEKINQISAIESTSLSTQIQSEKTSLPTSLLLRDQSDSQGEEEEEEVSESLHNSQQSHPLAMGIITGPSGLHFASSINLTTRGRSALSMANLCIDRDGSDLDKASDIEQNGLSALRRSHLLTSVSAYASDADNTEDDHHSICSQRSSTARSMSTICRHGHRQHHHHYRHVHNHNNRHHQHHHQNRARCLSAIDPYIIYNQNGDELNNQNSITNHKQDSCQADNQINDHGTHWKSQTFRRLSAVAKHQAKFSSNDQQDSLEFLLFLLDGLHEDLNEARSEKKNNSAKLKYNESLIEYNSSYEQAAAVWIQHKDLNNSIIVSSFQGLLRSTVKCNSCHATSTTFDVLMVLSLPIEQINKCQLTDCIKLFLEKEEMVGQCRWHCPTCNLRRDASKWIELWKLPTYLIIHLKRFRYEHGTWRKQTTNVDFPIESLDMSSFIVGPKLHSSEYALFSVLNHRGTMESGHYTTFCRNIRDGQWYEYDDENVSLLNRNEIQNDNAYILFYELLPRVGVFFENTHDTVQ